MKRREFMRKTMLASAVAGAGMGMGFPMRSYNKIFYAIVGSYSNNE